MFPFFAPDYDALDAEGKTLCNNIVDLLRFTFEEVKGLPAEARDLPAEEISRILLPKISQTIADRVGNHIRNTGRIAVEEFFSQDSLADPINAFIDEHQLTAADIYEIKYFADVDGRTYALMLYRPALPQFTAGGTVEEPTLAQVVPPNFDANWALHVQEEFSDTVPEKSEE